jgi:hypothetical protein
LHHHDVDFVVFDKEEVVFHSTYIGPGAELVNDVQLVDDHGHVVLVSTDR